MPASLFRPLGALDDFPASTLPSLTRSVLYTTLEPPSPRRLPRTYLVVLSPRFSIFARSASSSDQAAASLVFIFDRCVAVKKLQEAFS